MSKKKISGGISLKKKIFAFFTFLIFTITILGSCAISPPNIQTVKEQFYDNRDDISLITEYMIDSGCESIYIHDDSGNMFADQITTKIHSIEVSAAIKRLFNGKYSVITKDGNTILFQQWTRFMDAGCGIAYSINGRDLPEIQYLTELVPLSEEGWYYYVDDYNEWRLKNEE